MAPDTPPRARLVAAFATVYLVWGSTYLAIRWAVEVVPPFTMMGVRSIAAALVLFALAPILDARRGVSTNWPTGREWVSAAVAGTILFAGGHGALALAETRVASGLAALGCATLPLWIVALQLLQRDDDRPGGRALLGLLVGFGGVALLVGGGTLADGQGIGLGLAIISAFAWAVGTLYSRRAPRPASAVVQTGAQLLCGGVALLVLAVATGERPLVALARVTPGALAALGYLVVFGSVLAFTAFTWLTRVAPPARVGTYAFVNPAVAVLLGWALAGEPLTARMMLAMAVILAGVGLVTARRARPHVPESRGVALPSAASRSCGPTHRGDHHKSVSST